MPAGGLLKSNDYLAYFTESPNAYNKIVAELERTKTLFEFLRENAAVDKASSILSIGAGHGEVEIRLAKELGRQISVIEPSKNLFDRFMANASAAGISDQVFEACQQSFQEYEPHRTYELVISLFSWFAFGFDRQMLVKAFSNLAPTGQLLICLPEEANPMTKVAVASRPYDLTLTSEALSAWAMKEGFEHSYDVYHGVVPANRFVRDGNMTQASRDLVAFVAARSWTEVTEDVRSISLDALVQARDGDLIDFASGCLLFDSIN